jgi:uncharacterized lipoprotein YmbA
MSRRLALGALISAALGLGACRSAPSPHYYLIAPQEISVAAPNPSEQGLHLAVEAFRVDAPYDGDQLAYRVGRDSPEIVFYAHHRWAASLREQLALAVAASFSDLPGVASITPISVGRSHDGTLVGRLLFLEELDVPGEQIARLGLELALVDRQGMQVWSQTVTSQVTSQAREVPDIVRSMRQALRQAFDQMRPALSAAVASLPASGTPGGASQG